MIVVAIPRGSLYLLAAISVCIVIITTACTENSAGPVGAPTISSITVAPNPFNALSFIVSVKARGVESARVVFREPFGAVDTTPFYQVQGDSFSIVVLGLRQFRRYAAVVEGRRGLEAEISDSVDYETGSLPVRLRPVHLDTQVGAPSPGYILLALSLAPDTTSVAVAFDESGNIRWYREFRGADAGETKQQPNGDFTIFLGETRGWDPTYGRYVEFRPSGEIVRNIAAAASLYTDNHELLLTDFNGSVDAAHFFAYALRSADLSFKGGPSNALVAGHILLRESADGQEQFFWNAWDHFTLEDWIEPTGVNPPLDFDHPNSLDFDHDGSYVISFRNMGEITKIDYRSGSIIWRFGGRNNQFTIVGDSLGGFSAQHSVRVLENGNLLLYDNGLRHVPQESRAVEYHMDFGARRATLQWEYRHSPPIFTPYAGSVQRLTNGNTLVGFSTAGLISEVTPEGLTAWEAKPTTGYFYRATKIASLYRYARP